MQDVQQSVSDDLKKQKNQHKLIQLDQLMERNSQSGPIKILLLMIQLNLLMKLGKMQQLRTQYTLLSESVAPARGDCLFSFQVVSADSSCF